MPVAGIGELLGTGSVGERVHLAGLGHVPVLAELAGEIASGRAEREHTRPRQEMIERLLFDGIDAKAAGPAVAEELDAAGFRPAYETQPSLPIVQLAGPGADVALHASVVEQVPVARVDDRPFGRPQRHALRLLGHVADCAPFRPDR